MEEEKLLKIGLALFIFDIMVKVAVIMIILI